MAIAMYNGNEPYIFISYAHKNSDVVVPIIEALANNGFRVWYDAGIEAGTEWPEYVAEKLVGSAVVIAFISKAALESQNCRREINFAISRKKDILSVYIEDVTLTLGMEMQLSTTQAMLYNRLPHETFLQKLMAATILVPCRVNSKPVSVPLKQKSKDFLSDFEIENGVLTKYVGKSNLVAIPNGITSIGDSAFEKCTSLISVTLPNSVTSIGDWAFHGCARLTSITIPKRTRSIGEWAFCGCKNLTSIILPNAVMHIGGQAFRECARLPAITIPKGVMNIGNSAFYECGSLTIYCRSASKPDGWRDDWNPDNRPVVWGWKG